MFGFLNDPFYSEKKIALTADPDGMVEELLVSDYGEHNMLVYPNRRSFRQLYSKYCRNVLLENNSNNSENEMILIISYYDTASNIKNVLKRVGVDLDGELRKWPMAIMDSVDAYSCSNLNMRSEVSGNIHGNGNTVEKKIWASSQHLEDSYPSFPIQYKPYRIVTLISSLIQSMQDSGMKGLCVIADMGSFYLLNRIDELVDYECSYAPKFDKRINVKAFCCHHGQEIKKALTVEQQTRIFGHHNRNLLLTSS
ncbi:MAG: hypothetical protein ACRD8Z_12405 [Nitrososphaeraceae archaeon]